MSNVAIIGSGISGLSCANLLTERKIKSTIFEQKNKIGGLISCSIESGNLFHRVGGHVFNTKEENVEKWFWKKFDRDKEFVKAKRNAVIYLNDTFIKYPIELNLNQLETSLGKKVIYELIELSNKKKSCKNFKEFLFNNFGKTLYSIYFGKYNKKIWKRELDEIPIEWLEGKLPMINPEDILLQNIYSSQKDNMAHSTFYYPKNGGSQFIVERLSKDLNLINDNINKISSYKNYLVLNINKEKYNSLIFTGDIRNLRNLLSKELVEELKIKDILQEICFFDSNSTSTILCECDRNDYSWIYLPSSNIKPHRMIMTGNFSDKNNSFNMDKNRITCTIEYSGKISQETFKKELTKLPFNPKLISYNFCQSSYIIQNQETRKLIKSLKKILARKNIFLCGRFAEWEYFNMDNAINSAMKICGPDSKLIIN